MRVGNFGHKRLIDAVLDCPTFDKLVRAERYIQRYGAVLVAAVTDNFHDIAAVGCFDNAFYLAVSRYVGIVLERNVTVLDKTVVNFCHAAVKFRLVAYGKNVLCKGKQQCANKADKYQN